MVTVVTRPRGVVMGYIGMYVCINLLASTNQTSAACLTSDFRVQFDHRSCALSFARYSSCRLVCQIANNAPTDWHYVHTHVLCGSRRFKQIGSAWRFRTDPPAYPQSCTGLYIACSSSRLPRCIQTAWLGGGVSNDDDDASNPRLYLQYTPKSIASLSSIDLDLL
jgi:hypothetical protein